jgi:tetratricopeptide (TPR) repeat protein
MTKIRRHWFLMVLVIIVVVSMAIGLLLTRGDEVIRSRKTVSNYYEAGQYEDAIQELTRLLESDPRNAEWYWLRGSAFYQMGNYESAIADITQAIVINPEFVELYLYRGVIQLEQQLPTYSPDDVEQALADFNRAIELNPDIPENYYMRGMAYYLRHEHRLAIADQTYLIEQKPDVYPAAYLLRGLSYYFLLDRDAAFADLSHAIELDPSLPEAYLYLGEIHYHRDEDQQALENYQRYLELVGTNAEIVSGRVERLSTQLSRTPTPGA